MTEALEYYPWWLVVSPYGLFIGLFWAFSLLSCVVIWIFRNKEPIRFRGAYLTITSAFASMLFVAVICLREEDRRIFPCAFYIFISHLFMPLHFTPYITRATKFRSLWGWNRQLLSLVKENVINNEGLEYLNNHKTLNSKHITLMSISYTITRVTHLKSLRVFLVSTSVMHCFVAIVSLAMSYHEHGIRYFYDGCILGPERMIFASVCLVYAFALLFSVSRVMFVKNAHWVSWELRLVTLSWLVLGGGYMLYSILANRYEIESVAPPPVSILAAMTSALLFSNLIPILLCIYCRAYLSPAESKMSADLSKSIRHKRNGSARALPTTMAKKPLGIFARWRAKNKAIIKDDEEGDNDAHLDKEVEDFHLMNVGKSGTASVRPTAASLRKRSAVAPRGHGESASRHNKFERLADENGIHNLDEDDAGERNDKKTCSVCNDQSTKEVCSGCQKKYAPSSRVVNKPAHNYAEFISTISIADDLSEEEDYLQTGENDDYEKEDLEANETIKNGKNARSTYTSLSIPPAFQGSYTISGISDKGDRCLVLMKDHDMHHLSAIDLDRVTLDGPVTYLGEEAKKKNNYCKFGDILNSTIMNANLQNVCLDFMDVYPYALAYALHVLFGNDPRQRKLLFRPFYDLFLAPSCYLGADVYRVIPSCQGPIRKLRAGFLWAGDLEYEDMMFLYNECVEYLLQRYESYIYDQVSILDDTASLPQENSTAHQS